MADERPRLVSEVTDQFTGSLDRMQTALRRTAATGQKVGKDIKRDFEGVHTALGRTTAAVQQMEEISF